MSPRRIGLMLPSSNVVVEELIRARGGDGDVWHVGRIRVETVDAGDASGRQFDRDRFLAAAALLAEAEVDAFVWAGTAGMWLGLDGDRDLCADLERRFGRPATTASLAFVAACRSHAVTRLALVTPFVAAIHERIEAVLAGEGFEVAAGHHFGVASSRRMADIAATAVDDRVAALAPGVDAVGCVCTNMRVGAGWFSGEGGPLVIDSARQSLAC